ncbi:MAG: PadR family transcriptional regulator [Austwickia sp.]|nr:PadR family transcriptional regulator [Austwickia sp.]MCO5308609.1 PadR family transcriptional regulator [Austwickia sp.]
MHGDNNDNWNCGPGWGRDERRWDDRRGGDARGPRGGGPRRPQAPRGDYPGRGPREEFGGRGPRERDRRDQQDRGGPWGHGGPAEFGGIGAFFGPDGPFGAHGPFGPNGPFGANGPFGEEGPFGPRGPFGGPGRAGSVAPGPGEPGGPMGPSGRRGHRGHRGGSRGQRGRARRGDVRLAILGLLAEGDLNGYQVIRTLDERTGGAWRPSPGAIYPALAQLEDEGLIVPADGGGKVFTLTDAGRAEVEQIGDRARPWEGVAEDVTAEAEQGLGGTAELWVALGKLGLATRAVGQAGDPDVTRAATELLEESRRGLYRLLAQERADDLEDDDLDDEDPQDVVVGESDDPHAPDDVVDGEVIDEGRPDHRAE